MDLTRFGKMLVANQPVQASGWRICNEYRSRFSWWMIHYRNIIYLHIRPSDFGPANQFWQDHVGYFSNKKSQRIFLLSHVYGVVHRGHIRNINEPVSSQIRIFLYPRFYSFCVVETTTRRRLVFLIKFDAYLQKY